MFFSYIKNSILLKKATIEKLKEQENQDKKKVVSIVY